VPSTYRSGALHDKAAVTAIWLFSALSIGTDLPQSPRILLVPCPLHLVSLWPFNRDGLTARRANSRSTSIIQFTRQGLPQRSIPECAPSGAVGGDKHLSRQEVIGIGLDPPACRRTGILPNETASYKQRCLIRPAPQTTSTSRPTVCGRSGCTCAAPRVRLKILVQALVSWFVPGETFLKKGFPPDPLPKTFRLPCRPACADLPVRTRRQARRQARAGRAGKAEKFLKGGCGGETLHKEFPSRHRYLKTLQTALPVPVCHRQADTQTAAVKPSMRSCSAVKT